MKRRSSKFLAGPSVAVLGSSLLTSFAAPQGTASAAEPPIQQPACPKEVTLRAAPNVPSELVGKTVPSEGCSIARPENPNGEFASQPEDGGIVCSSYVTGFDNGYADLEIGAAGVQCSGTFPLLQFVAKAYMYYLIGGDWVIFAGPSNTRQHDVYKAAADTQYSSPYGPGTLAGQWKELGDMSLYLPPGYGWDWVQSGCTGQFAQVEQCENMPSYWTASDSGG